ncbi:MAG: DMT family transporter [Chloroflexota bacterium]|nr:DMT family transporter [Chloroflexota bacterium]
MTRRAWALFGTISLLWGLPYLLIKVAIAELDPSVIVFARVVMSAIVLLPVALVRGALPLMLVRWRAVLALAVLEIVAPFLLIAYGETHITSALAGLLIAADPLFIALLALRLDRSEGLSGLRLMGLLLGFSGVVALLGLDLRGDALGLVGAGLVLLAALCYAGGALLIKRSFSDVSPVGSVAASLTIAAIPLAILAASHVPDHAPSAPVVVSVLVLGLACTAFGFLTYFSLIAEAGATSAALITYVNPAVAVVLGALVLSEPITPATIAGFACILLGCWLSTGGRLPRRARARPVVLRPGIDVSD